MDRFTEESNLASKSSYQFWTAAKNGILTDVVQWADIFRDDVTTLSKSLLQSCEMGHSDIVKWLVNNTKVNVNYADVHTPLTAACEKGYLDVVDFMVVFSGCDVNLPNFFGHTPLIQACRASRMTVSKYLLFEVSDIDVNLADNKNNTALHYAIWCSKHNFTRLHQACEKGNVVEVQRLIYNEGFKIDAQDDNGDTPLHIACKAGDRDVVSALMIDGADETLRNDNWYTPADVAMSHGHYDLIKLLNRDTLWDIIIRNRRPWTKCTAPLLILSSIKRKIDKTKMKPRGNYSAVCTDRYCVLYKLILKLL